MAWQTVLKVWALVCGLIGCAAAIEMAIYYANGFRYKPPKSIGRLDFLGRTASTNEKCDLAVGCISLVANDLHADTRTDVVVMDLSTRTARLLGVEQFRPKSVCMSADGNLLAIGSSNDAPLLVNLRANLRVRLSCPTGMTAPVWKWAFCPQGKKLVGATSREIVCWDVANSKVDWQRELPELKQIQFSSDCKTLQLTDIHSRRIHLSSMDGSKVEETIASQKAFPKSAKVVIENLPFQTETGSVFHPVGVAAVY